MKSQFHILACLALVLGSLFPLRANVLPATDACPLIDHLIEINKEWSKQELTDAIYYESIAFTDDTDRIQKHLELVEHILRKQETNSLSNQQYVNRLHQLDLLRKYHLRKQFPKNTGHSHRQPYFIDQFGTACAVGYLAIQSGQEALAQQIKQENNFAYIRELDYPVFLDWASANGLTEEELAWIQPGYQPIARNYATVGNNEGVTGTITKMIKNTTGDLLYFIGNFSAIDGVEANSIAAWDGQEFFPLGNGVEGTVNDIAFSNGLLYIGGNFTLLDDPNASNFAVWDGEYWEGLQHGDMEGEVLALYSPSWNKMMVGGTYQKINGDIMPYLAQYDAWDGQWSNEAAVYHNGQFERIQGGMTTNGPVRSMVGPAGAPTLIGGDFTQTAPNIEHEGVNSLSTNYLAYWNGSNWVEGFDGAHGKVHSLATFDGSIYVGSTIEDGHSAVSILSFGLWNDFSDAFVGMGDHTIHGFLEINDILLTYGGFSFYPIVGTWGNGVAFFQEGNYGDGFSSFNSVVTAVAEFQGRLLFAGDFTEVDNQSFPGLTQLDFLTSTTPIAAKSPSLQFYSDGEQVTVFHESDPLQSQVHIFNMMGQELGNFQLQPGSATTAALSLPSGTYAYRVQGEWGVAAGKFVVARGER
ncbi:MAG: T9SS type A sorting domain-containing protein [Bacteroidota bacterium]